MTDPLLDPHVLNPANLDPRIDPTASELIGRRTIEWVLHEIARLNDASMARHKTSIEKIDALDAISSTRYARAIEKIDALVVADAQSADAAKELVNEKIAHLTGNVDEKFRSQTMALELARRNAEDIRMQVVDSVRTRALLEERLAAETTLTTERFRAHEEATLLAQKVADKSAERLSAAVDTRFAAVNEFRAQLSDIIAAQITRVEADARFAGLDARVIDIKSAIDKGFTGVQTSEKLNERYWGYIVGVGGLIALVATMIINALHIGH